jgi:hypothetical protein
VACSQILRILTTAKSISSRRLEKPCQASRRPASAGCWINWLSCPDVFRTVAAEAGEAASEEEPEQRHSACRAPGARRAHARGQASFVADLRRLQDQRKILDAEISAHKRRKHEVLATLAEVVQRDELLRDRDRLRAAVAELEEQVSSALAIAGFEQARSILDAVDLDSLASKRVVLKGEPRPSARSRRV